MSVSGEDAFQRLNRAVQELAQTLRRLESSGKAGSSLSELLNEMEAQGRTDELLNRLKRAVQLLSSRD
uniref:hypothetical protein n=1 Tax=Brucella pseudintermedia TaxID=370111 RepID=UPI00158EC400|nr:hypothetical protein [Brucella pseudintermedia]